MLEIRGLEKKYGSFAALSDLDLKVEDHSLFGLMGQNGAGKTTLIKLVTGLMVPDRGQILVDGIDAVRYPEKARRVMGYVPDHFGVYNNLTVREYMEFFAAAYGLSGRKKRMRCEELLENVGLEDKTEASVDTLSRGMQQRLCIARALVHDPKFLVMDEPTSGLDPGTRFSVREMLQELCVQGKTILISSHILPELSEICTDIGILDKGRMKVTGEVSGILKRIGNSNPLRVTVLNGAEEAMRIFRRNPCVQSVVLSDRTFSIGFAGTEEDESVLLMELIDAEIPVNGFMREPGSLESFFLSMTGAVEEKVILRNEDESDL